MTGSMLLVVMTITGITQTPVSTARRLMIDGSFQQAETVLDAVLEADSSQRTAAGFMLEVLHQIQDYYNLSASEALNLARSITGDRIDNSWFSGRLAPTDTILIDGIRRYPGFRIEQLAAGHDSPFPFIHDNSAWLQDVYNCALTAGFFSYPAGISGTYSIIFELDSTSVRPGDTVQVWIPIAGDFELQEASIPDWEIFGINVSKLQIHMENPGRLPVFHIAGIVCESVIIIQIEQAFTVYPVESVIINPDEVVLPVPGSSAETDLALVTSEWIDPTEEMFILARHISGNNPDPLVKVESIVQYITDSLRICQVPTGLYMYEGLSRTVRRNRCGDTAGISAFFAAACRSLGIPARVCGGYSCSGDDQVYHCRNDFMISDGIWTPVDVTFHLVNQYTEENFLSLSSYHLSGCDAARVYTLPSLEDTLYPAKKSWPVTLPGSLPEAEKCSGSDNGFWHAVSLSDIRYGTEIDIQWQF